MPNRNELVIRANAVGLDPTTIPNDSKLEQKVLYLEKNGTAYTGALGVGTATTAGADVSPADTLTIGNRTYTFVTNLSGVKATGILTSDATAPADGDVVTIEGRAYTFRTALSVPVVQNEVLIGVSAAVALDNIKQAINQGDTAFPTAPTNEGQGTNWSAGTVRHSLVTATTNTNTQQTVQANNYGTYANQFALSETSAHLSWGAPLMGTVVSGEVAGVANVLDQIKIQVSAAVTLDVLKDAINATSVVGTPGVDYSSGTVAHNQVTATTNGSTTQVVQARSSTVDNGSIATTNTGSGNMVFGAGTLASGVRTAVAANTTTYSGSAGISGDANVL